MKHLNKMGLTSLLFVTEDAEVYYEKSIDLVKLGRNDEACDNLRLVLKYDYEYRYDILEVVKVLKIPTLERAKKLLEEIFIPVNIINNASGGKI